MQIVGKCELWTVVLEVCLFNKLIGHYCLFYVADKTCEGRFLVTVSPPVLLLVDIAAGSQGSIHDF